LYLLFCVPPDKRLRVFIVVIPFYAIAGTIGIWLGYRWYRKEHIPKVKHNLTLCNKFSKEVMIMASPLDDADNTGLNALTVIGKDQTKTIENAVFLGQSSTILAKDTASSGSDNVLFIRKFTEEELEKLNWTVVIEPGYEVLKRPDYYPQAADPFNPGNG
jgi:hypothetical protein